MFKKLALKCNVIHHRRSLYQTAHNTWSQFLPEETHDWHSEDTSRKGPQLCDRNMVDFLIVGGGVMGHALAYNIWRQFEKQSPFQKYKKTAKHKDLNYNRIMIVEKDPTLQDSATLRSVGGLRTQFSEASNVQLSMLTANFMRNLNAQLSTYGDDDLDVQFHSHGYLMLATSNGVKRLLENYETQTKNGAKIMLMDKHKLKSTYPWLNVDQIELGALGIEHEGWFDPNLFVNLFKKKNKTFPIKTVRGEVVGTKRSFYDGEYLGGEPEDYEGQVVEGVHIKVPDVDKPVFVKAKQVINCAGYEANKFAQLCGIGCEYTRDEPELNTALPVERRKRYVYAVHCPDGPVLDCPMLCDPSGFYVRREGFGGMYLCGKSPNPEDEPSTDDLEVDYDFFEQQIWPELANRAPAFENLKVKSAWAGFYDYNTFDQNAIIGQHPFLTNLFFLNGFSGHGIQQAYGASLCLAELMVNGEATSADISPFSFERIVQQKPFRERNVI